jgi:RimJ/RimL family protein N-acetyltransferase
MMIATPTLNYRTIDSRRDARLAVAHQLDACICSFGNAARFQGRARYLAWLQSKLEEFPEGFLLAFAGDQCVGQLELEVPYGLNTGYVNLFYLTPEFRGRGFGSALHLRAEIYFRNWEASRVELHCSPTNQRALRFYAKLGYRPEHTNDDRALLKMSRQL